MSGSVNKCILIGNVGRDPEIRAFKNGGRVASFSLATSESYNDKLSGEKKERTEWHRISVLNDKLVEVVERYVKKGSKLYIEGQLETRKWTDKDGSEKYTTEVTLRPFRGELNMLDGKEVVKEEKEVSTKPAFVASVLDDGLDDGSQIPF